MTGKAPLPKGRDWLGNAQCTLTNMGARNNAAHDRVSDHTFPVPGRYDFDVYTASPRKGASDYTHFLAEFRRLYAKGG
jgi:hypothetical protein